jgi:hypothetical protein
MQSDSIFESVDCTKFLGSFIRINCIRKGLTRCNLKLASQRFGPININMENFCAVYQKFGHYYFCL